ncbi:MAG: hypothetical protein V3U75_04215 [Methylococcaceae bacterium]
MDWEEYKAVNKRFKEANLQDSLSVVLEAKNLASGEQAKLRTTQPMAFQFVSMGKRRKKMADQCISLESKNLDGLQMRQSPISGITGTLEFT